MAALVEIVRYLLPVAGLLAAFAVAMIAFFVVVPRVVEVVARRLHR